MTQDFTSMKKRWVIVWLIIFWPVGLYILIKRVGADKTELFKGGKTLTTASYVLAGLAVLMLLAAFVPENAETSNGEETSAGSAVAIAVIFGAGAAVLNWYARGLLARAERYRTYITMVVNQQQTSVDNIAAAVGVSYDTATKDLQRMINLDYFTGAHLDTNQREVVLATPLQAPVFSSFSAASPEPAKIVPCSGCGANNRVTAGQAAECEYCGSPLS